MTKSQAQAADIAALLRARNTLLWVVTNEEARVERYLFEACASAGYVPVTWDCAAGVCAIDGTSYGAGGTDPGAALDAVRAAAGIKGQDPRSEEHTSELQSLRHLVCRL